MMEKNVLTVEKIESAQRQLAPHIYKTALELSHSLSTDTSNVFLKLECQQVGKSFKIRGALNKMFSLNEDEKSKGVATVSSGNHGIAVSFAAKLLNIEKVCIIVPRTTPDSKIEKIKFYGGEVLLMGNNFDEANLEGMNYISGSDMTFIDGGDLDEVIYAGQGTVGLEILEQNPLIDTILVPIGGGALLVSIAIAVKSKHPKVKIIGVYSEACPAWTESNRQNVCLTQFDSAPSVCEAMVGGIGRLAFEYRHWIDDTIMVREESVKKAMVHAIFNEKISAEASGAVPIAAILEHGVKDFGKNIALVITGGNANDQVLKSAVDNHIL